MVARTDTNVILLPIMPRYAKAIIEGEKKIEFRKLNIPMNIEHVVIYSASPDKRIVGFFSVSKITKATPKQLWKKFKNIGCVEKDFLFDYYSGHKYGLAIHVGKVEKVQNPFSLAIIKKTAPQSFMYLENKYFEKIKGLNQVVND